MYMKTLATRFAALSLLTVLAGCATVNPFTRMSADFAGIPEEALRAVAADIEQAVAAGEREPVIDGRGIVIDTPAIKATLRERAIRSPLVHGFLQTGHAYEQRGGLISILRTKDYKKSGSSGDRDRNAGIVISENQSRWTLYEGIMKANDFSPRSLSAIQEIFADARIAVLPPDAAYEASDGTIVRK